MIINFSTEYTCDQRTVLCSVLHLFACNMYVKSPQAHVQVGHIVATSENLGQDPHFDDRISTLPLAHRIFIGRGSVLNKSHGKLVLQTLAKPEFTMPAEAFAGYKTLRKSHNL